MTAITVPKAFIWRRVHSLMGLWLVLFLLEHLLTNSQAALWLGDDGKGFVQMVDAIHNLPFLQVIEIGLLGIPLLLHLILGVRYLFTSKPNTRKGDGSTPHLPLPRNRAYSWQRITSWILLVCLIGHVVKFRFLQYPDAVKVGGTEYYLTTVQVDEGIYTLAERLGVTLYDGASIANERKELHSRSAEQALIEAAKGIKEEQIDPLTGPIAMEYSSQKALILTAAQQYEGRSAYVSALEKQKLGSKSVVAVTKNFGTASLLVVRDTFKQPLYVILYTIFVLAACFHACNGFWTFLLSWGWILKASAQRTWVGVSVALMGLLLFLGLAAIWGTYWINLRY
ncbi:MAG: succinate dehydrogenase [Verrucomicrobia bacterium]|nr:succinate dehydrogenase [Verrucomicrobiota bacterium]